MNVDGDGVTPIVLLERPAGGLPQFTGVLETTDRLKVALALETPLPLAVTVTVWLLTIDALAAAVRLIEPLLPVPGWVILAETPLDNPLTLRLTLPV